LPEWRPDTAAVFLLERFKARRELLGSQASNAPEETADNAEVVEEWNVVASSAGHRAPRVEDDENVGEHLVEDGIEEAVSSAITRLCRRGESCRSSPTAARA